MSDALAVWMYGVRVAVVERRRTQRLRLTYTDAALEQYPLGAPLLSLRLPVTTAGYPHGVVSSFLDGLLPEGDARRAIADDLDVRASDTYALIEALGRDCAGALVILPDGAPLPLPSTADVVPLTAAELEALVANLRSAPLGVSGGARLSLAGVQEKLVLTRVPNGGWALPDAATPSTHILKPQIAAYPLTVENEVLCMRFAKHLGLTVAAVETISIGERRLIVVERYDRAVAADGAIRRIHQEDFCQALAIHPEKKYEEDGGPSLRKIARILADIDGPRSLETLLRAVTVNIVIGNGDAHGKNFSLVHAEPSVQLAPLYDLVSTQMYGEKRLAMYIDGLQLMSRVSGDRLINEAAIWGLAKARAADVVADLLARVADAASAAASETKDAPQDLPDVFRARATDLLGALRPTNGR